MRRTATAENTHGSIPARVTACNGIDDSVGRNRGDTDTLAGVWRLGFVR